EYQEHMLAEVEEADLTHHNAEYRMLVKEYREGILLFSLMNDMVWQKALMDSVGQLAYYEEHIDQYQWPERVQGLIVSVEDESQLAKVRRFLQRSEEHTSELQSRENLVCRLLLEKKKL